MPLQESRNILFALTSSASFIVRSLTLENTRLSYRTADNRSHCANILKLSQINRPIGDCSWSSTIKNEFELVREERHSYWYESAFCKSEHENKIRTIVGTYS